MLMRAAHINASADTVGAYLPANYRCAATDAAGTYIVGVDSAGWTLDGYVLPRLASGLYFGREIAYAEVPR
jgi:hypothetical protein